MKKLLFVMFMAAGTMTFSSCNNTAENRTEETADEVEDSAEEAGDEIEEGAEEAEEEVEGAANDAKN